MASTIIRWLYCTIVIVVKLRILFDGSNKIPKAEKFSADLWDQNDVRPTVDLENNYVVRPRS